MFNRTKKIRLKVNSKGMFIMEDKVVESPQHPTRLLKFSTPDSNGPELCKLIDSLKEGQIISLVYDPKIVDAKPTEAKKT